MDTQMKLKTAAVVAGAMLLCLAGVPAQADDSNAPADEPTIYLGKMPISGKQKIVDTLLAIKKALKEPVSNDPAKASTVVCRINTDTGSRHQYLDCATNRDLAIRHEYTQEQMLARRNGLAPGEYGEATQMDFDGLISAQPNHRLHVPIFGAALQSMLDSLPDDAKVVDSGEG